MARFVESSSKRGYCLICDRAISDHVEVTTADHEHPLGFTFRQCPNSMGVRLRGAPADPADPALRSFSTGATRSPDHDRIDPEGFLNPLVVNRFAEYMHKYRRQSDGQWRDSDNWQKGIPCSVWMKGLWRHFLHLWLRHRGYLVTDPKAGVDIVEDLCAIIFGAQGYMLEVLKGAVSSPEAGSTPTERAL